MHGHPYLATAIIAALVSVIAQLISAVTQQPGVTRRPTVWSVLRTTVLSALFCSLYAWAGAEWAR